MYALRRTSHHGGETTTVATTLHIHSLSKTFPGQVALNDVALDIEEGEVQVEDKPNLNKPLQSKVPLPGEATSKDPIASIAAATQGPEYWLQTGAYRNQDEAQRQKAMLAMQGLEALISERELDGAALWRVRVGPFVGQSEVTQTRARLQSAGIPSTIIRINKSN